MLRRFKNRRAKTRNTLYQALRNVTKAELLHQCGTGTGADKQAGGTRE